MYSVPVHQQLPLQLDKVITHFADEIVRDSCPPELPDEVVNDQVGPPATVGGKRLHVLCMAMICQK